MGPLFRAGRMVSNDVQGARVHVDYDCTFSYGKDSLTVTKSTYMDNRCDFEH